MDAAELRAKWVATLRSGNYEQGEGQLRDAKNRCCCVGVLCDIADPAGWRQLQGGGYTHSGDGLMSFRILKMAGIGDAIGRRLASMNDGTEANTNRKKHSFSEIADYIEAICDGAR